MNNRTIIAVAPNGARKSKKDLPQIPIEPEEIAQTAKECLEAGASMIHLHVRDKQGGHSLDISNYQRAINAINQATDESIFVQVTSESVGIYTPEQQFNMIEGLKPPGVSIGIREIKNLEKSQIRKHFEFMRKNNILPQLILYSSNDIALYKNWLESGVLPGNNYPLLLVIGKKQIDNNFEYEHLNQDLISSLNVENWMVCGFSNSEFKTATKAVELGGNIRIGFENNHLLENNDVANSNAELIQQMVGHLSTHGFNAYNFKETSELMRPDW